MLNGRKVTKEMLNALNKVQVTQSNADRIRAMGDAEEGPNETEPQPLTNQQFNIPACKTGREERTQIMLKPGIYIAENNESIWNSFKVRMEVKETEGSYIFILLECDSQYAADHIRMLFAKSNRFVLHKDKERHAMRIWSDGSFTLYPFQAGIPYYFKLEEQPIQKVVPGKKWIQIWYSRAALGMESPVEVPSNTDAWEYAKKLAVDEACTAYVEEGKDEPVGLEFFPDEGKIVLHYDWEDKCYYLITDVEKFTPDDMEEPDEDEKD